MQAGKAPVVSVIVCTFNRHKLVEQAVKSVLGQSCEDMEVIVVDDGSDPPVELGHTLDRRVRIVRIEHSGVGAARFEGLNAACGEYIAYCDDDDEWRANHLEVLLEYLRSHPGTDLVYGDSEWLESPAPPSVPYSFDFDAYTLSGANYIFASDVLHRAEPARNAGGFDPSLRAYEDWDLWLRMSRSCTIRHIPAVLTTHRWHENCVSAQSNWQDKERVYGYHQALITKRAVAEIDVVRDTPPRVVPFEPETWHPPRRELLWHTALNPSEGYGTVGRQLLLACEREGIAIKMAPTSRQPLKDLERFYEPAGHWDRMGFYHHYWSCPSILKCERLINLSMWESTHVPTEIVNEINLSVTLQYVPCRQNAEAFRDCGVRVPIEVLHLGVDPDLYPYLERDWRGPFTFGTFGDLAPRKGVDVLTRAFQDEFAPGDDVRLILKTTAATLPYDVSDPRIHLITGVMHHIQLLELLRSLNAFVLPSRGEGFGLAGLQAMSTGLPTIATNWSGPAEYLDAADSYPLSYQLVDARGSESRQIRYFGQWAEPDYEHLRYLMRWLYENPCEARTRGESAARRVHRDWTWRRAAKKMCSDLDMLVSRFS